MECWFERACNFAATKLTLVIAAQNQQAAASRPRKTAGDNTMSVSTLCMDCLQLVAIAKAQRQHRN